MKTTKPLLKVTLDLGLQYLGAYWLASTLLGFNWLQTLQFIGIVWLVRSIMILGYLGFTWWFLD